MNASTPHQRRRLPRAVTAVVVGLGTIMTLAAADLGTDGPLETRTGTPAPDVPRVVPYQEHPAASIVDTDTRKLMATQHIPGYGGAYVDPQTQRLHVWLTQPTQALGHHVRAALSRFIGPGPDGQRDVVVQRGAYSFAQLKAWKDAARTLFALPETVFLDASERHNRLLVGVQGRDELPPAALEVLSQLGIPRDAVVTMNVQRPPTPLLRDDHRPLTGGTQIQFQAGTGGFGTGTCTLGFPAVRDGILGFVTNAHCSRTRGEVDDGRYWQATRPAFDTNQVGTETVDLPFFAGDPCPADRVCSFLDANFVRAHDGVGVDRGRLASAPCCGSLDWNGTATWRVTDNFFTFTGNTVRKVGRTTGTTFGQVVAECAETDVNGTNIHMFCQDIVQMTSDFGDSGSPIFEITHSPTSNDVRAVGVLWGIAEDDEGTQFTFLSPTPFVHDLITGPGLCAPGFGC